VTQWLNVNGHNASFAVLSVWAYYNMFSVSCSNVFH